MIFLSPAITARVEPHLCFVKFAKQYVRHKNIIMYYLNRFLSHGFEYERIIFKRGKSNKFTILMVLGVGEYTYTSQSMRELYSVLVCICILYSIHVTRK